MFVLSHSIMELIIMAFFCRKEYTTWLWKAEDVLEIFIITLPDYFVKMIYMNNKFKRHYCHSQEFNKVCDLFCADKMYLIAF